MTINRKRIKKLTRHMEESNKRKKNETKQNKKGSLSGIRTTHHVLLRL